MATAQKQQVRLIFKIISFGAFIMLSYLGIRSYHTSVEMAKINICIDQISEISRNVQDRFLNQHNYGGLDYKRSVSLDILPKGMFKAGFNEAVNAYNGGVDLFYSALSEGNTDGAFEVSFQGISHMACEYLIRMDWDGGTLTNLIAVGGYPTATPSGVLDEIYSDTKQSSIKKNNIFMGNVAKYVSDQQINTACGCKKDTCTMVWKFH